MIYECPSCSAKFKSDRPGVVLCPTCNARVTVEVPVNEGCAWDRAGKGGWASAFFETIKLAVVDPVLFFSEIASGEGWHRPLAFSMTIYFLAFAVAAAYQAGFQALALSLNLAAVFEKAALPITALSLPLMIIVMIILAIIIVPVFVTLGLFLQAGIYHLCLTILGSARRDFWTTFRTVCYAASPQVFQIVPLFGGLVGPIWQLVLAIIGLKVVHKTTYGRSALAIFLPTILCCGMILLVLVTVAGGVAAALLKGAVH